MWQENAGLQELPAQMNCMRAAWPLKTASEREHLGAREIGLGVNPVDSILRAVLITVLQRFVVPLRTATW